MTVKAYLALLVGVFVVALVAVSVVHRDLAGVARDVTRSHAPRARAAHELRAAHLAERRALAGFLLAAEPAESARLQQARRDLRRWRGDLGAHLTSEDQAPLAEIDRLVAEEQAVADQAVELRRSGRAAEARELADQEADPPGERVDELLAQLSDITSRELDADAARAERTAAAAGRRTVLLPLLVILAVAGFALWVVRRVLHDLARPFHAAGLNIRSNADRLSAAVQQLAATTAEQSSGSPRPRPPWRSWPGRRPRSPRPSTTWPARPAPPGTTWSRPGTTSGPRASAPSPWPTGSARSASPSP